MKVKITVPIPTKFDVDIKILTEKFIEKYFVEDFKQHYPEEEATLDNNVFFEWCNDELLYCDFDMGIFYELACEMLGIDYYYDDSLYDETDTKLQNSVKKYFSQLKK